MNYQLFQKKKCVSWSGLRQAQGQGGGFFKQGTKRRQKQKGQISIFAILIFPVLFMIFAMSINITLVVHDKINLQNSVDLAAYYGAMKQAEMLNAIAHINYQIRQSWKLLAWRYRVLGTMGASAPAHAPAYETDRPYTLRVYEPMDRNRIPTPYFVCIGHKDWKGVINPKREDGTIIPLNFRTDNLCHDMVDRIPKLDVPVFSPIARSAMAMLGQMENDIETANDLMMDKCTGTGYNSWLLATHFFLHFRLDQSARKIMIYYLAKKLEEGIGLDGEEEGAIERGARKTFIKNLTYANRESLNEQDSWWGKPSIWKAFNSLQGISPRQWLMDQPFRDYGFYSAIKGEGGCDKQLNEIRNVPENLTRGNRLVRTIEKTIHFEVPSWPECVTNDYNCRPSAGLRKIKDAEIYYKVEVNIPYKGQIFFPWEEEITLKAKAIAKPFGGTIGPDTTWDNGDNKDPRLPKDSTIPHHADIAEDRIDGELADSHLPNYSRYPGDEHGLKSQYVHHYWANKLRATEGAKYIAEYLKSNVIDTDNDPLASSIVPGSEKNVKPGGLSTAREWELLAISPDLFDVTYFTILPYYEYAYFDKVRTLIGRDMPTDIPVRGDLGSFYNNTGYNPGTILSQIQNPPPGVEIPKMIWQRGQELERVFGNPPTYKITDPAHLLTGWNPPTGKYKLPIPPSLYGENPPRKTPFGTCQKWAPLSNNNGKGPIANGCVIGGRTGYSVKLVKSVEAP